MNKPLTKEHSEPHKYDNQNVDLLFALQDEYQDWLLNAGSTLHLSSGDTVIAESSMPEALYFLVEGLLRVHQISQVDKSLAMIAPGQLVGEMGFIERVEAAVSVTVVERSILLKIPYDLIDEKMEADAKFESSFQNALLAVLSNRLRETSGKLNVYLQDGEVKKTSDDNTLFDSVDAFKKAMFRANELEIKKETGAFEAHIQTIAKSIRNLFTEVQYHLGDHSDLPHHEKEAIGYQIQQEVIPYFMMSNFLQRIYTKPRGYAGDYLTIAQTYDDVPIGNGMTGKVIDRLALNSPAAQAVKNRRGLMTEEITKVIQANSGGKTNITSFACGPAQEVFDTFAQLEDPKILNVNLIDIDIKALAFVTDKIDELGLSGRINLHQANLIYLAMGRKTLKLPAQDLVYSIGLIDYFNDALVVKLLNYAHKLLKPGGKIILGNFHPQNMLKGLMDHVIDWRLIHRTEEDMNRLFESSSFASPCTAFRYEQEKVNLFACCEKK